MWHRFLKAGLAATLLGMGFAAWLPGCDQPRAMLVVRVMSDLRPGAELLEIRVRVHEGFVPCASSPAQAAVGSRTVSPSVADQEALAAGRLTVAELSLPRGVYTLVGEAVLADQSIVQCVVLTLQNDRVQSLRLASDCRGVSCPSAGGTSNFDQCLRGACVDPRCDPDAPPTSRWCCDPAVRDDCRGCTPDETCNGADDDCDDMTDEGARCAIGVCGMPVGGGAVRCLDPGSCVDVGCAADLVCVPGTGRCENPLLSCAVVPCDPGFVCDVPTGLCVALHADGAECGTGAECESGRCYPRDALRLAGSGGVCSRACCADDDCAADQHCAAPGTGARGCVRGPRTGAPVCASDSDCDGSCALSAARRFECAGPRGGLPGGALCTANADCESGLCDDYCLAPCGTAFDCPSPPAWSSGEVGCPVVSLGGAETSWGTACIFAAPTDGLGPGRQGAACATNGDCRDGFCEGRSGRCLDTCCRDEQCPADHMCAPIDNRGWEMRCVQRAGAG